MAEDGKERRVNPRKDVSLRVRVRADNVDDFVEQFAHNISKGGLFLRSQKPYPVDTELHFEIQLKDGSSVLRGKGKVTWSQPPPGPGEKPRNSGMGLKFLGLDASSKALVQRILEHKEEENSPPTPAPAREPEPEPASSPAEDSEEAPTVEVELTPPEQIPAEPAPAKPEPAPVEQRATPALPFWRRVPLRAWLLLGGVALGALIVLLVLSLPESDSPKEPPPELDAAAVAPPSKEPVPEKIEPPEPAEPPVEKSEEEVEPEIAPLPIPRKSPAKRRFGYLSLNTNPWVEVYLGPRKLGVTPLVRVKLRAGKHRLKLVNWEKGINSPLVVKIRPGKTTKQMKRF